MVCSKLGTRCEEREDHQLVWWTLFHEVIICSYRSVCGTLCSLVFISTLTTGTSSNLSINLTAFFAFLIIMLYPPLIADDRSSLLFRRLDHGSFVTVRSCTTMQSPSAVSNIKHTRSPKACPPQAQATQLTSPPSSS